MSDELAQRKATLKERVRKILELCDPDKADKVQMLLNKFEGRERELFQKLEDTYAAHENYPKTSLRLDPQLDELLRGLEAARAAATAAAAVPSPVIHGREPSCLCSSTKKTVVTPVPISSTSTLPSMSSPEPTASSSSFTVPKTETATETKQAEDSRANNVKKMAEKQQAEQGNEVKESATTKSDVGANGELIIRTCIFTGCRRARTSEYLCHKHAQLKSRTDGLLALVTSWSLERHTTMTVMWEIQMLVLPSSTKYGQKVTEPLQTVTKLRFSDLQALYKKIKAIHKSKPGYHDDLKELPKFADKHELSTAGKFFGSNEVYNDEFLAQRQTELQAWLDKILDAPKIKFISEFWSSFGLRCVDGEYLEKESK